MSAVIPLHYDCSTVVIFIFKFNPFHSYDSPTSTIELFRYKQQQKQFEEAKKVPYKRKLAINMFFTFVVHCCIRLCMMKRDECPSENILFLSLLLLTNKFNFCFRCYLPIHQLYLSVISPVRSLIKTLLFWFFARNNHILKKMM